MQPTAYPIRHTLLTQVWDTFTTTGHLDPPANFAIDPAVLRSWQRCAPRFDPHTKPRLVILKEQALTSVLRIQADLMMVAVPYMEDIHQFIEGSDCVVLLTDGTACLLEMVGDETAVSRLQDLGIEQGTYWAEGQLGTNALGMTLIDAMPVQVVGAEHYFQAYHHLATTAAPVHDVNGRIIAILAIVGLATKTTSHTLSLVMAAARAIGNQIQANFYLGEANRRLTEVNTVLESIHEGVIAWNDAGKITHVNVQAGKMFQVLPRAIVGHPLERLLELPPVLQEAVQQNSELRDVEITLNIHSQLLHTVISLRPVFEGASQPVGYIAMLRPIEQVRQLVHQQVGTQATLTLEDISAQSPAMRHTLRQAAIAARGTAPVLLRGEGGVGKNHLGRAIHNGGGRADKPFITINCRAIPHELMASEFLGYEDGRPSKFELANGGTLLLDQIENLSLEMQAALLQLIETGHTMRLRSTRLIPVDVRIIAATSSVLEQYVSDGNFNRQLYYRFGVFSLPIPSLRERVEDIPLLAERFLARLTQNTGRLFTISAEALEVLRRYPWPGNVRELENVLERAINHNQDGMISLLDLPDVVRSGRILTAETVQPQPIITASEAEREAIIRAGWACQGHVTEMAQQLGIGRTTLWRKMRSFHIMPSQFKR